MTWTVREGRTTRYLYICRQEGEKVVKIAELDLWTATPEDAVLMASAPTLAAVVRELAANTTCDNDAANCCGDSGPYCQTHGLGDYDELVTTARAIIAQLDTLFVQDYKPAVSAE